MEIQNDARSPAVYSERVEKKSVPVESRTIEHPHIIELYEQIPAFIPVDLLGPAEGEQIWRRYGQYIDVGFPSPRTNGMWQLTSLGWAGSIPVNPELRIVLHPKVVVGNLFRMLEYAYRLKSFHLLDGTVECRSLEDIYDRLAAILAYRVLDRRRAGLYRSYVPETDDLPYLRGSIDVARLMRVPWSTELRCHFEDNTADVEDNQILAWTLYTIMRQGVCRPETARVVRSAFRGLGGSVSLRPFTPHDCTGRVYNRLNSDYRQLHALCRFFLEQSGPSHEAGDRTMLPFIVNMGRLYELFVAEWLQEHLPDDYRLVAQESVSLNSELGVGLIIDLVIYDRAGNVPLMVLDTKYKTPRSPSPNDRDQIIAYAAAVGCRDAILIYPDMPEQPFDGRFGASTIHLRTMQFGIEGDLEEAGVQFLEKLLVNLHY